MKGAQRQDSPTRHMDQARGLEGARAGGASVALAETLAALSRAEQSRALVAARMR